MSSGFFRQRAFYRAQQFFKSLWPRIAADERAILALWLPRQAVDLFGRMVGRDRRHGLDVFYTLRSAGQAQPDLLAAALLHDVGKSVHEGRRLWLWQRVLIVLLAALRPGQVEALAAAGADPRDWRHLFFVHVHHPRQGAELALAAGCSSLTATLIRRHQEPLVTAPTNEADRLLAALQAADDMN